MVDLIALADSLSPSWLDQLQAASYNGVPFVVEGSSYSTGRRVAIHEYPFRDNPWVEDLGLNQRTITFQGFLVGDDCYKQRDKLKKACEKGGDGILIHPSMGRKIAALVNASFAEGVEKGRVVTVQFQFVVVDDKPRWPSNTINTQFSLIQKIGNFLTSLQNDFQNVINTVKSYVNAGLHFLGRVLKTIHSFISLVTLPFHMASAIFGLAKGLISSVAGSFTLDRFNSNFTTSFRSSLTQNSSLSSQAALNQNIANIITTTATLRQTTNTNFATVESLANPVSADTSNLTSTLCVAMESLRACINDPNDQITILKTIAEFNPTPELGDPVTGPTGAVCRRAALASLANAVAAYIPSSASDALTTIASIKPIFDKEILYAADNGDTSSYITLRDLRAAIMLDMQTRGSALPPLITITTRDSLPSLMLAWDMYADAARQSDLCDRNQDVIHPLFFNTKFEALST